MESNLQPQEIRGLFKETLKRFDGYEKFIEYGEVVHMGFTESTDIFDQKDLDKKFDMILDIYEKMGVTPDEYVIKTGKLLAWLMGLGFVK